MLRYHKTYYINTENTGKRVEIEKSGLQYLNHSGSFGWCDPLATLSMIFTEAQLKNILTNKPAEYCLVLDLTVLGKRKTEDRYNSYDIIDFIINEFKEPTNGLILSIYLANRTTEKKYLSHDWHHNFKIDSELNSWTTWPFHTKTAWGFKKEWNPKTDPQYITFQKTEPFSFQINNGYNKNGDRLIQKFLDSFGMDYKIIDYTIPPNEVFEMLLGSSLHISYVGASWWLANYMKVPVLDHGHLSNVPGSLFGFLSSPPGRPMPNGETIQPQIAFYDGKFREVNIKPTDTLGFIEDSEDELYRISQKILGYLDAGTT